jgi:hypothetical protein
MTNSALRLAALITIVFLLFPRPAAAGMDDIWDYIDALSGPGPFHGHFPAPKHFMLSFLCRAPDSKERFKVIGAPVKIDKRFPCLFVDHSRLVADKTVPAKFYKVDAQISQFGASWQPVRPIEVGFAFGAMHFNSNGASTTRKVFTPVRVVVNPLLLIPEWEDKKRPGFLKYYVQLTLRKKRLTGRDFGVDDTVLNAGFESLLSYGVVIDIGDLIHW